MVRMAYDGGEDGHGAAIDVDEGLRDDEVYDLAVPLALLHPHLSASVISFPTLLIRSSVTWSHPLSNSSSRDSDVRQYAKVFPVECIARYRSLGSPPSLMNTSAKDGSPIALCSLNTAIFRTDSSSLLSRCTSSRLSMLAACLRGDGRFYPIN